MVQSYFYGAGATGAYGVPYQLDLLARRGLKATYFTEALFADAIGLGPLQRLVSEIEGAGQEVQLHLHTEWLTELTHTRLPSPFRQFIREFGRLEQEQLIAHGVTNLRECGAGPVVAFRAGSYGANVDTLRALAANGIAFDSSHNPPYVGGACGLDFGQPLLQPRRVEGVWEFPVSVFEDYPGHLRPAQLCACSFGELATALERAWQAGWQSFVIVLHSFELVRGFNQRPPRTAPDTINLRRFERLCAFLAENRDRFPTRHFRDLDPALLAEAPAAPVRGRLRHTLWRHVEQAVSRFG